VLLSLVNADLLLDEVAEEVLVLAEDLKRTVEVGRDRALAELKTEAEG